MSGNNKSLVLACALVSCCFLSRGVVDGAAVSRSCIYVNGEYKCAYQEDPNGNVAGAAAGINGGRGVAGAGAGTQDNFNTDYQQIGYGGENGGTAGNEDYQPYPGNSGGGFGGAQTGAAYPNNFPQFNGNPFDFVRDFFQGRG